MSDLVGTRIDGFLTHSSPGVNRGTPMFLIIDQKYRLRAVFTWQTSFEQKYLRYQHLSNEIQIFTAEKNLIILHGHVFVILPSNRKILISKYFSNNCVGFIRAYFVTRIHQN